MSKKLYTIIAIAALAAGIHQAGAQSFSLSGYSPVININDPNTNTDSYITISNTTGTDKIITIQRIINTLAPGHDEFFCFGFGSTAACYPPGTTASGGQDTLPANSSNSSFKATLMPLGNYGYTSLHYRFFDTNNPSDSVGVELAWNFTTSIGENTASYGLSKPLQNPADAFTVFTYNLQNNEMNDQLVVFNMLGAKVKSMDIPGRNGTLILTTSDLKAGVYLVSYMSNGRVKDTTRLVVSHR